MPCLCAIYNGIAIDTTDSSIVIAYLILLFVIIAQFFLSRHFLSKWYSEKEKRRNEAEILSGLRRENESLREINRLLSK